MFGEVPERSKGADCKSVGLAFEGPNPSLSSISEVFNRRPFFDGVRMFYENGLNFECQRCRYCCSVEPGYVFLSEKDLERLSSFFGLERDDFIRTYCRLVDYGQYSLVSLTERSNYDCEFLSPEGCTVYEARPEQCRTYPFWANIVQSEENWNNEKMYCRGIGKGRKVSADEIRRELEKGEKNAPYVIFRKPKGVK